MDALRVKRGETVAHQRLKRAALLWAQEEGFAACAPEVSLPRCRFRADVAAYRPARQGPAATALFECKQAVADLRRDNGRTQETQARLRSVLRRRDILERNLRVHYPTLRCGESLFPEFDRHEFDLIGHRGYTRVVREVVTLQSRLLHTVKFEKLRRYRCANLFYLVVPESLLQPENVPPGWGVLVERKGTLVELAKPAWHEVDAASQLQILERIARAGTRALNRQLDLQPNLPGTFPGDPS